MSKKLIEKIAVSVIWTVLVLMTLAVMVSTAVAVISLLLWVIGSLL